MIRRARIQARPNLASASQNKPAPPKEKSAPQPLDPAPSSSSLSADIAAAMMPDFDEGPSTSIPPETPLPATLTISNEPIVLNIESPPAAELVTSTSMVAPSPTLSASQPNFASSAEQESPHKLHSFTSSQPLTRSSLGEPLSPAKSVVSTTTTASSKGRRFTGKEKLDRTTFRMSDLISWNPRDGQSYEKRKSAKAPSSAESNGENATPQPSQPQPQLAAPQVKIAEDGTLIVDETSLTVCEPQQSQFWEVIDDDRRTNRITSLSFRNRIYRKTSAWSDRETDLFYEILQCTGPDFGLMHEFFPTRARAELKKKFNREEKVNWARVSRCLAAPGMLDDSLYDRASAGIALIEEEQRQKKEAKEGKKKSKGEKRPREARKKKGGSDDDDIDDLSDDSFDSSAEDNMAPKPVVRPVRRAHRTVSSDGQGRGGKQPQTPATIDWDELAVDLEEEAASIIRAMIRKEQNGGVTDSSDDDEQSGGKRKKKKQQQQQKKKKTTATTKSSDTTRSPRPKRQCSQKICTADEEVDVDNTHTEL